MFTKSSFLPGPRLIGASLGILFLATNVSAAEFHVSPTGDDGGTGSRTHPFASIQKAQAAVRAARVSKPKEAVMVNLKAGVYRLSQPLEFTTADSGASSANPVTYRAERGARVEITGGHLITGWALDPSHAGLWKTRVAVPTSGDLGSWRFSQLWVNGERAIRARTPNQGTFGLLVSLTEKPGAAESKQRTHDFKVQSAELASLAGLSGDGLKDVQVMVYHNWDTTREALDSATPAAGTFSTHGEAMQTWNPMKAGNYYFLENYLGALDSPGEWFLARDGWLYYQPRPGEDMTKAEVVSSSLERLLTVAGQAADTNQWVQHLRFEGLRFNYSEFRLPAEGLHPGQAVMNVRQSALQLDAANDIQFRDCAFEHIGTTAIWFHHACKNCRVEHTRMFDLGISGVRIGEESIMPEPRLTSGITIDNCIIQTGGRLAPHAVAVWIGHNPDNAITHCDIGDFFYTAISVGWRWGYDVSAAKRNRIEFNKLHHLGYGVLSDLAGVYTLGPSEGTVVRNNIVHDVRAARYGGWGLYTDEGSTGILLENNLIYDVFDGCFHQHYGKENIFRNNILAFSDQGQVAITRAEPHLSFTFDHNLVYWDEGKLLGYGGWANHPNVAFHTNLYWKVGGWAFDLAGQDWKAWQAAGNDDGSILADPLFVNPEARDFRLKRGSPALKLGFKPFDLSLPGVQGNTEWKRLAESRTYPAPLPPQKN